MPYSLLFYHVSGSPFSMAVNVKPSQLPPPTNKDILFGTTIIKEEPGYDDIGSYDCSMCFESFRHSRFVILACLLTTSFCDTFIFLLPVHNIKWCDTQVYIVRGGSFPRQLH